MRKLATSSLLAVGLVSLAWTCEAQRREGGGLFGGGGFGGRPGNTERRIPQRPPWEGLVETIVTEGIKTGLQELRRDDDRPSRPPFTPFRPRPPREPDIRFYPPTETIYVPSQPTTVITTPSNTIPSTTETTTNAVPVANSTPVEPKPEANKLTSFRRANRSIADRLDRGAERLMEKGLDELDGLVPTKDELLQQIADLKANNPAAAAELDRLTEAVTKGDGREVAKAVDALKGLPGANPQAIDRLKARMVAEVDIRTGIDELQDAMSSGASAAELRDISEELLDRIEQGRGSMGLTASEIRQLQREGENLVSTAILREQIEDALDSDSLALWPNGTVNVVTVPSLPGLGAGQVIGVGPGLILIDGNDEDEWLVTEGPASDYLDTPVLTGAPVAESSGASTKPNAVMVVNPSTTGGEVTFTAAGKKATLKSGYQLEVQPGLIEFDRGGEHGTARYTLAPGSFYFRTSSENGWDLKAKQYSVVIDNSKSRNDFHYVIGPENHVVRGGETKTHTSGTPIQILFDRGDGKPAVRKDLADGTYVVAMSAATSGLDIFTKDAADQAEAASAVATTESFDTDDRRERTRRERSTRERTRSKAPTDLFQSAN